MSKPSLNSDALTIRDEYTMKLKLQLDGLNARMDELEEQAREARADACEKHNAEMTRLRHQSTLAAARYEELKTASEDSWAGMVAESEKVRDAFVHSFRHFKSQI